MRKQFVFTFLLTLGLALGAIAALNFFVNPYALYPPQWLPPLTVNDVARSLHEMEQPGYSPELVVFGSSRSSRLTVSDLKCYSGYESANQAYSGATPAGNYALASYLLENKPAPKMFIIGVDVESFNADASFADRASHVVRLQKYLEGYSELETAWRDYSSLFSAGQFSDSFSSLAHAVGWQPDNPLDRAWVSGVAALLPNDPGVQRRAQRALRVQAPDAAPRDRSQIDPEDTLHRYENRFRQYKALSPEQERYFELLLKLAHDHQVEVKLFITTMHPRLIELLNKQGNYPARHAEVIAFLRQLRQSYPFELYDLPTPATFGGNNKDFFNLAHIDEKNSARVIALLFSDRGRSAVCGPTAR